MGGERWRFLELADLRGVPELDPDRDAPVLLHPRNDAPLERGELDEDALHQRALERWQAWLAS